MTGLYNRNGFVRGVPTEYDRLISICVLPCSPFSIIPPMLHTNLYLNTTLTRRAKRSERFGYRGALEK